MILNDIEFMGGNKDKVKKTRWRSSSAIDDCLHVPDN